MINYIIKNQVDEIIENFENKSAQHSIDLNGTKGQIGEENWTVDKVWEIKQEMNQIQNQIVARTYAPGTGPGGGGVIIDGGKQGVITDDGGGNVVDNDVAGDNGGYAPGTGGDSPGNNGVNDGDNVVVTDDMAVDSGAIDSDNSGSSSNDVAGVDLGPEGIVGVVEETGPGD